MFELGGMTLKWLFHKPATKQYPKDVVPVPAGRRGHIENDIDTCILCNKCAKSCPAGALEVSRTQHSWSIDPYRCIQCGHCVTVCPTKSLTMSEKLAGPTTRMNAVVNVKPEDSSGSGTGKGAAHSSDSSSDRTTRAH